MGLAKYSYVVVNTYLCTVAVHVLNLRHRVGIRVYENIIINYI
jgi:hypothetical protein